MSRPNPIFKGVTLFLTRRVSRRRRRLRPGKLTNRIVGYVLAVMQKRWGMLIHCVTVMPNHWHVVFTDPDGNVVEFKRDCHNFIAQGIKVHFGDEENLWAPNSGTHIECVKPEDILRKIVYTMGNPVEGGQVKYGGQYPGLRLSWPSKPVRFKRPPRYFRGPEEGGGWPEEAILELSPPPGFEEYSRTEAELLESNIFEYEEECRQQRAAEGKGFVGRKKILTQSRWARPRSDEPRGGLRPLIACCDRELRIQRLRELKQWRADYQEALARWRDGDRDVVFPAGTYKMRVLHNVNCAEPPG